MPNNLVRNEREKFFCKKYNLLKNTAMLISINNVTTLFEPIKSQGQLKPSSFISKKKI